MSIEEIRNIEREYEIWKDWHCMKKACDHNMCRIRSAKLCELRIQLAIQIDKCREAGIDVRLRDTSKPTRRRR